MNKGLVIFGPMGSGKDTVADMMLISFESSKKYNIGDIPRSLCVATKTYDEWESDNSILKEFLTKKIGEFKINADVFCEKFELNKLSMDTDKTTEKITRHFLNVDLWKNGVRPLLHAISDTFREIDRDVMNYFIMGQVISEENNVPLSIIVGGRTPADFEFYKKYGFKTIGIKRSHNVREQHLIQRDGVSHMNHSSHNTEKDVEWIVDKSDIIIKNEGSLDELNKQIKELIQNV